MQQTFINLKLPVYQAITAILASDNDNLWLRKAEKLHERYFTREKEAEKSYIRDFSDALAYLGLRVPATYAQISSALLQIQEVLPFWQPKTLLDIGSGPGAGVWATQNVFPTISQATCIDNNIDLLEIGKKIVLDSNLPIKISWKNQDIRQGIKDSFSYDVVLLANVLNELTEFEARNLVEDALYSCKGVMVIVEPGTAFGNGIINTLAKNLAKKGNIIAPFIQNSFTQDKNYWIHFPQKFIRPEFQRRIRQHMRDSTLMASDYEEAKYAYIAVSKVLLASVAWGRCVGPVKKQKGFLEVPILTKDGIVIQKILKRHKKEYTFAKNLKCGELIHNRFVDEKKESTNSTN